MRNLFFLIYIQNVIKLNMIYFQFSSNTFIEFIKNNKINNNRDRLIKELNEEKKKNTELLNQLSEEKMKNEAIINELNIERKKKEEVNNEKKKIDELTNKLKLYENTSSENINKIKELQRLLNDKKIELKELRTKFPDLKSVAKQGDKIIVVNFVSINQDIQFPIACKNTDIIERLEEKFYNEYPKYKKYNTYLTNNGKIIKRFKSLDENGIKNGSSITVNIYDEK